MLPTDNEQDFKHPLREAAEHYQVPSTPSWERMSLLLDDVMPVQKERRKRFPFFWWIILFFLFISTGVFFWKYNDHLNSSLPIPSTNQHTASNKNAPIPNEIKQSFSNNEKIKVSPSSNTTAPLSFLKKSQRSSKKIIDTPAHIAAPVIKEGLVPKNNIPVTSNQLPTAIPEDSTTLIKAKILFQQQDAINTESVSQPGTDTISYDQQQPLNRKNANSPTSLSVALLAGGDISTVGFDYTSRPGINIGLMAGYHFNNQLSLHTGIIYTSRSYKMNGEDFHPPKGSWIANYQLATVDGFCNMYEWPLSIRYTFTSSGKDQHFISGGISSYFMTRENYNYAYYFNGNLVNRRNDYQENRSHWLSSFKLTGGWHKKVGSSSHLLIEPYLNIPLQGVGLGSIKLSSMGMNISWQWKQPKK